MTNKKVIAKNLACVSLCIIEGVIVGLLTDNIPVPLHQILIGFFFGYLIGIEEISKDE
jgi:hypothetical protein